MQQAVDYFANRGSDDYSAHMRAVGSLAAAVLQQAYLMAFDDCFLALGSVLLVSLTAIVFLKRSRVTAGAGH